MTHAKIKIYKLYIYLQKKNIKMGSNRFYKNF